MAAAVGLVADRMLGEPPIRPHPVALFGRAMRAVEARLYADRRSAGVSHAAAGLALGMGAGLVLPSVAATYLAVAGQALGEAATQVAVALEDGDLEGARRLLPALVGRDPTGLDEKEIARAAVESVAENTVDAVVAPALWGAVFGASGALGYRAVNTLDAMVGHRGERYERYGWASARLDDLAGWVPARATAALVIAVRPSAAGVVWRAIRDDAPAHPSPNAGVAEAAFAAALGLRLGGTNHYGSRTELRPPLGIGRPAEPADIARAVRLSHDVGLALAAGLAAAAGVGLCGARCTPVRASGDIDPGGVGLCGAECTPVRASGDIDPAVPGVDPAAGAGAAAPPALWGAERWSATVQRVIAAAPPGLWGAERWSATVERVQRVQRVRNRPEARP